MEGLYSNIRKVVGRNEGPFRMQAELLLTSGECAAIFGPSGSGKTTLLRNVAGLESPDEGEIVFNGIPWFDSKKGIAVSPQKRRIGFVFQDYALFPTLSVAKNIAFGMPKDASRDIDLLLKTFDLQELRHRLPHTLSGGQKQRVALARACAQRPLLLLLDEPLSALDIPMRGSLQDELARIKETLGVTTILVSHDVGEIFRLADKVFKIDSGSVISSGTPHEVFHSPHDRLNLRGRLIEKRMQGVVCIATVAIGSEVSHLAMSAREGAELEPGKMITISVKAFNPQVSLEK